MFATLTLVGLVLAKPPGPKVFCETYPTSPSCVGQMPSCAYCHTSPPARNAFGTALEPSLAPSAPRPLSDGDFAMLLPAALRAVEGVDTDGDGASNQGEFLSGTLPADPSSVASGGQACPAGTNPGYQLCGYDPVYAYRRVVLDVCGVSPTYTQLGAFRALGRDAQLAFIDAELDRCLGSEFWLGKNGQLWRLAHPKIRPVGSLKEGEDRGIIPLADYYDDYALFAYTQTGDRDAREILTADYFVQRSTGPTRYTPVQDKASQAVDRDHRAGVMTSAWSLVYFVMFTALPRNIASQMYRAYLGLDIARQEGLRSVAGEPKDYDAKGVTATECAACHATLDPLSYPFRNYNGIAGRQSARYLPGRIELVFAAEAPSIVQIPESGVVLGTPVADLKGWAQVAADSDAFAVSTVTDYWKLLVGHRPTPEEHGEFVSVWERFKTTHRHRVQPMLHDLVRTEAYGAP